MGNPDNKIKIKDLPFRLNFVLEMDNDVEYIDPKELYGKYYENAKDKYPDSTKAFTELGWKPTKSIEDMIEDYYIEYQRLIEVGHFIDDILTEGNYGFKE